jgi:uncharacterized protein YndB with AHSA1/START domain
MSKAVIHNSFVVERVYPKSAEKVFQAFSDPVKKRRWFAEGEGFELSDYSLDFRVGGFERSRFSVINGPALTNDCVYLDIVDNERMVFAYSMTLAGNPMSSSLGCIELLPHKEGTLLKMTEHTAYVDGNDGGAGRKEGTIGLFEALAKELGA